MAEKMTVGGCASEELSDNHIRWVVYGIALNQILVPSARPYIEGQIQNEYTNLKSSHNIHTQTSHNFHGTRYPKPLNYENINGNDTKLKGKKYDHSKFDYKVTSHVDFAKLFLQHHMAKFNAFDGTCDASAVLILLGRVPVFSAAVQKDADVVRAGRNSWGHCNFSEWNKTHFQEKFDDMKNLVQELGLKPTDESKVLEDLKYWEMRGVAFCANANIDSTLVKVIQERVNELEDEIKNFSLSEEKEKEKILMVLGNFQTNLTELEQQVANVKQEIQDLKENQEHISADVDANKEQIEDLKTNQEIILQQVNCRGFQTSFEISSCEAEINSFAKRHDPATRQWLIEDFESWFRDPGDSRAYVLLGDPAVGKTVMSAVLAQRATKAGYLGAAYFCRHKDATRNNPRYLLGSITNQLSNNCPRLNGIVCGEGGIQSMLANPKAGVTELFTKLLQEPLSKYSASSIEERKLVVIDGLDETEYDARDDFLDLIMNRFPLLPKWLVFFITSRPEDNVRLRLKTYNPCIKICAGNSITPNLYEQHEKDIVAFLDNEIGSLDLPCSIEKIARGCSGSFLLAYFITEEVKSRVTSGGSLDQLSVTLPQNIDGHFRDNFKRIFDKVEQSFYEKIFGCAVVTPSPLPISFVRYIVQRENSDVVLVQSIVDAVSQFLVFRESDKTLDFRHNLIPAWLTDGDRNSSKLLIDRTEALKYFKKIVVEILSGYCNCPSGYPRSIKGDGLDFILRIGIRFLSEWGRNDSESSEVVFKCLTNYDFIAKRLESGKGIHSIIEDVNLSVINHAFDDSEKEILRDLGSALTRDIHVLLWYPELLHSCLRSASQKLSEKVIIPDNFATSLIDSISWPPLHYLSLFLETVTTTSCYSLSHDKKLFAMGKGQCIYLFDAYPLGLVKGPIQVMDDGGQITSVAFSLDDSHVFFGRLDRWLSVQKQRPREVSKFSRNSFLHEWGFFICDNNFIVVGRSRTEKHNYLCLINLFCEWTKCELEYGSFDRFATASCYIRDFLNFWPEYFSTAFEMCPDCREFQSNHRKLTLKVVRGRVVDLYSEIFDRQVWNVQTGRPVIEEMFSSGNQLDPFFYYCHIPETMTRAFDSNLIDTPGFIALANSWYHGKSTRIESVINFGCSWRGSEDEMESFIRAFHFRESEAEMEALSRDHSSPRPSMVTPVEYRNHFLRRNNVMYSHDGKWSARYKFSEEVWVETLSSDEIVEGYYIGQVERSGFSSDNSAFVYHISTLSQDLHALSLRTGNKLQSVSGLDLTTLTQTGELGYLFRGHGETKIMHLKDLPMIFFNLFKLQRPPFISIGATFTSKGGFMCLSSIGTVKLFEIKGKDSLEFDTISSLEFPSTEKIHIKKCAFAAGCHMTAIHTNSEIELFQDGKFLCRVKKEIGDYSVPCMRFSADGRLLLFCLERSRLQAFHVWDVHSRKDALPKPIELSDMPRADCCCFSPDNTKLIFCDQYSVKVLEYAELSKPSRLVGIPGPGRENDNCTHCTVSSVNESPTLACCIANKIFVYPLTNTVEEFQDVPHGHLGRVEFCQFLKGNRYLISYGVDGFVFLTDLSESKTIAYVRTVTGQESIVGIAVSPEEDKVVCLKSNGDLSVISLNGLTSEVLSNLQLPELDRTQSRKPLELKIQSEFDEDDIIIMSGNDFGDFDEYESESNEDNNEDIE